MEKWLHDAMEEKLIPVITDYIKIPNQSRNYDKDWATNGLQKKACEYALDYACNLDIKGMEIEYYIEEGRTPVVIGVVDPFPGKGKEVTANLKKTILMYGHLDKQPPLTEQWSEGLYPYIPVRKGNKLYGRGGADDGYAFFSCATIVKALQANDIPHNRIILFFETDEESGSHDLMHYLQHFKDRIETPEVIFCLDSGITDYDHMCLTTTLRGIINFKLRVDVLKNGVHSGDGGGVVPSSFRILRKILNDFENQNTGELPADLYVDIPEDKYTQAVQLLKDLGGDIDFKFPFIDNTQPMGLTPLQNYLNRIWKPQLAITGIDGLPSTATAGNVLLPYTEIMCSMRLPPTLKGEDVEKLLCDYFDNVKPLYDAKFSYEIIEAGSGFMCPNFTNKFLETLKTAGAEAFGNPMLFYGEGGSIPFLNQIKNVFPESQFVVSGLLGPESNAHAPDEMLRLDYLEKLVVSIAKILQYAPDAL